LFLARSATAGPGYFSLPPDDWDQEADEEMLRYLRERTVHADPVTGEEP
jgi:hypothetical protein